MNGAMLLRQIVETSAAVAATRSRSEKVELLAACIAGMDRDEVAIGAGFLAGEPRQRRLGAGWAALRELPPPASDATLTLVAVDAALERIAGISGAGSQAERAGAVHELFAAATEPEQEFLRRLILSDLRQGALQSAVTDAVARAASVSQSEARRALMLLGDAGELARIAVFDGIDGLRAVRLEVGRPVQPMLAGTAPDLASALAKIDPAALEWKLDGARIQVHRSGDQVSVFTRSLDEVTDRVPEVVEAVRALDAGSLVLDGEAIALQPDGRPHPFQVTGSRFGSRTRGRHPAPRDTADAVHLRHPARRRRGPARSARRAAGAAAGGDRSRVHAGAADGGGLGRAGGGLPGRHPGPRPRGRAGQVAGRSVRRGPPRCRLDQGQAAAHARPGGAGGGVGARPPPGLAQQPAPGRPRGRRQRLRDAGQDLQGADRRDPGLADRSGCSSSRPARHGITVEVHPELVVEIAFDGLQRSSRYPGGVALRFARVLRYRDDKRADEADTLAGVLAVGGF